MKIKTSSSACNYLSLDPVESHLEHATKFWIHLSWTSPFYPWVNHSPRLEPSHLKVFDPDRKWCIQAGASFTCDATKQRQNFTSWDESLCFLFPFWHISWTNAHLELQSQVRLLRINQNAWRLSHWRPWWLETNIQVWRKCFLSMPWLGIWIKTLPRRLHLKSRQVSRH